MKKVFWRKAFDCPLCEQSFEAVRVFSNAIAVKSRDYYLKTIYEGANPNFYNILVCPFCFYAAYESDFENLLGKMDYDDVSLLKNALVKAKLELDIELNEERELTDAINIHTLAAITYTCSHDYYKLAQIYLKMSWFYEDKNEREKSQIAGAKALELFQQAFEKTQNKIELDATLFFIGSLHIKFRHYREGGKWLERLIKQYRGQNSPYLNPAKQLWEEMRSKTAHE